MARNEIHVGDTTKLRFTIKDKGTAKDVSSYTSERTLWLRRPDGTTASHTLAFSTDGTNGKVEYDCTRSDLDVKGQWEAQVYIEASSTDQFRSDWVKFPVFDNLDPDRNSPL